MNYCQCETPEPIYEQDNTVTEDGRVLLYEQGGYYCELCNKIMGVYEENNTE